MKFTVHKTVIVNALSTALGIVEKRSAFPILSNILLSATDDGQISITATDEESQIKTNLKAKTVEEAGKATAPANKLSELCKLLPEGADITIYLNNEKLFIESGSGKYAISTLPSEDFPIFRVDDSGEEVKLQAAALKNVINKTFFAIDTTTSWERPYLKGLYLKIEDKNIIAVSTDAHRLATTSSPIKKGLTDEASGIIPKKAVSEIGKLLSDLSSEVSISLTDNIFRLETISSTFSTKLIAHKFPNYERTIPSGECDVLKVNTKMFTEVIRRVRVLSDHNANPVLFQIKSNKVLVSTAGRNQEEAKESLNTKYDGDDIEIAFKSNYLQDIFTTIESEECHISLFGTDQNCLITSPDDPNFKCILMPLLISQTGPTETVRSDEDKGAPGAA